MGCINSTSVLLGLLLSLAALSDSHNIANAHRRFGIISNNENSMGERKKHSEALSIAKARTKWPRGRRMGAMNEERNVEDVKGSSNTVLSNVGAEKAGTEELKTVGKPSNSSTKPTSSSTKDASDKGHTKRSTKLIMSGPSSTMAVNPHRQIDAATQMFDMLSRDYSWAHRRPPVNNDAPFDEKP